MQGWLEQRRGLKCGRMGSREAGRGKKSVFDQNVLADFWALLAHAAKITIEP